MSEATPRLIDPMSPEATLFQTTRSAEQSAAGAAKSVPAQVITGYHHQVRTRVKGSWRRANATAMALALGLCAVANVVRSFSLAVLCLILSVALPAVLIPDGVRSWFRYRRRQDDGRLRATVTLLAIAGYLYTLGVLWFAGATHRFAVHGWLGFDANHAPSLGRFGAVYLYHFADMIPLVSIPKTARWSEPIAHGHMGLGVMILMFELVIIVPLIAVARAVWAQTYGADSSSEPALAVNSRNGATQK
jgi:hypothetical protein